MTREEKAKAYDKALEWMRKVYPTLTGADKEDAEHYFPELKESEDERIGNVIYCIVRDNKEVKRIIEGNGVSVDNALAYLEKQQPAEWSEEDEEMLNSCISSIEESKENRYAYKENDGDTSYDREIDWLKSLRPQPRKEIYQAAKHVLAIKFMNYLDNNKPEGKMCLSNGECEDIDKAFKENDWAKIIRYAEKYQIQKEQKPEVKLTGWVARDENKEIWVYGNYPGKNSEKHIWTESSCMPLDQKSFPDLKWEDEPVEVEITIRKK